MQRVPASADETWVESQTPSQVKGRGAGRNSPVGSPRSSLFSTTTTECRASRKTAASAEGPDAISRALAVPNRGRSLVWGGAPYAVLYPSRSISAPIMTHNGHAHHGPRSQPAKHSSAARSSAVERTDGATSPPSNACNRVSFHQAPAANPPYSSDRTDSKYRGPQPVQAI